MKAVIVGGGIGGLEVLRNLNLDATLIEPRDEMIFYPLLPEFIVDKVDWDDMTVEISEFCDKHGVHWIRDRAVSVESDRVITERDEVEFDYLIISVGAKASKLENTVDPMEVRDALKDVEDVLIVGSGSTGVEFAFELRECGYNVKVLECLDRILPTFSPSVSRFVTRLMEKEGIEVFTSCRVLKVDRGVKTDRGEVECDVVVSCVGLKPNPIDGLRNRDGWIVVDDYLRVGERVFAIGDCAFVSVNGEVATKTVLEAERQAKVTAKNVERLIEGRRLIRYRVHSSLEKPTSFITLARNRAILIYRGILIPRPMKILYKVKKNFIRSFMNRFKT